jgi:hypothetical protein
MMAHAWYELHEMAVTHGPPSHDASGANEGAESSPPSSSLAMGESGPGADVSWPVVVPSTTPPSVTPTVASGGFEPPSVVDVPLLEKSPRIDVQAPHAMTTTKATPERLCPRTETASYPLAAREQEARGAFMSQGLAIEARVTNHLGEQLALLFGWGRRSSLRLRHVASGPSAGPPGALGLSYSMQTSPTIVPVSVLLLFETAP